MGGDPRDYAISDFERRNREMKEFYRQQGIPESKPSIFGCLGLVVAMAIGIVLVLCALFFLIGFVNMR